MALLVDDNPLSAAGLRLIVEKVYNSDQIKTLEDPRVATALAASDQPAIFIVNYQLRQMPALDVARGILRTNPQAVLLLAGMPRSSLAVLTALTCGVRGLLLHSDAEEFLVSALRALRGGCAFFSPEATNLVAALFSSAHGLRNTALFGLSDQEMEILKRLALGEKNKIIAAELNLSLRAVQSSRARLSKKLRLKSAAELVRFAYDEQLL